MIRLNCFFQAKEGQYNRALDAAIVLVAKSQKHAGCISYDVFESATRPDVFCFIETWADQPSLLTLLSDVKRKVKAPWALVAVTVPGLLPPSYCPI